MKVLVFLFDMIVFHHPATQRCSVSVRVVIRASLFTHAKEVSEASARQAGVGEGFVSKTSKNSYFYLDPHPLPSQVFRFALVSSSLAILSMCSM